MVATRGRTFKRPWRRSCHSSKLKSSSAPIGRKDSWRFHAVGSSNAPLLGSTAAEGLQRIGRTSIATRWRSCGSPQSASCSENFVIPPDVFGQTLSENEVLELVWRTAKPADRPEDGRLLTREPGVDQKGVCHPHRDDMHAVDHTLHAHRQDSFHRLRRKRIMLIFVLGTCSMSGMSAAGGS